MHRFFFDDPACGQTAITLRETTLLHQIGRVLRMAVGDTIVLFRGDGLDHCYTLTAFSRDTIEARLTGTRENTTDPHVSLTLFQAFSNKHDKIEYLLQKGTEAGISRFVFFRAERSSPLVITRRHEERFTAIVREAVEQSGRNRLPEITFHTTFPANLAKGHVLVCHGYPPSLSIRDVSLDGNDTYILVGPEGGFSDAEIAHFHTRGYTPISLGERILRTETVGVVVAFFLLQR